MSNTKTNRDIFNFLLSLSVAQLGMVSDFLKQLEVPVEAQKELRKRKRTGPEAKKTPPYKFKVGDKVLWTGDHKSGTIPESWATTPLYISADCGDGYFDVKVHNIPSAASWPVAWTNLEFVSATKKPAAKKKVKLLAVKKKYPPHVFVHGEKAWWKNECGKKQSVIVDRRDRDSQWYFVRRAKPLSDGTWLAHERDLSVRA